MLVLVSAWRVLVLAVLARVLMVLALAPVIGNIFHRYRRGTAEADCSLGSFSFLPSPPFFSLHGLMFLSPFYIGT